jgi:hypothetical protein
MFVPQCFVCRARFSNFKREFTVLKPAGIWSRDLSRDFSRDYKNTKFLHIYTRQVIASTKIPKYKPDSVRAEIPAPYIFDPGSKSRLTSKQ